MELSIMFYSILSMILIMILLSFGSMEAQDAPVLLAWFMKMDHSSLSPILQISKLMNMPGIKKPTFSTLLPLKVLDSVLERPNH